MKRWWARINTDGNYGRWVPTPCTDLDEAKFYASVDPQRWHVIEWLQL